VDHGESRLGQVYRVSHQKILEQIAVGSVSRKTPCHEEIEGGGGPRKGLQHMDQPGLSEKT